MILAPLLKLPKNVGDLGKFVVAKGLKSCPKCKKLPTLVTLPRTNVCCTVQLMIGICWYLMQTNFSSLVRVLLPR